MSGKNGKLESWAFKFIVVIAALAVWLVSQTFSPGNTVGGVALVVAIILAVWGAIEFLMTKRRD